jgi:hypothetical protein
MNPSEGMPASNLKIEGVNNFIRALSIVTKNQLGAIDEQKKNEPADP